MLPPGKRTDSITSTSDRVFPIRSLVGVEPRLSSIHSSSQTGHCGDDAAPRLASVNETPLQSGFTTTRFKHKVTNDGHMVITGIAGAEKMQRCEDEPIATPGAVQGFGCLLALKELTGGAMVVKIASENSETILGYSPTQLFALCDFSDILSAEQAEILKDHIGFAKDDHGRTNSEPEVFLLTFLAPDSTEIKLWCTVHITIKDPGLVICEFELDNDRIFPLNSSAEELESVAPADTLESKPTEEELEESTKCLSKPLRALQHLRREKGEAAVMSVYNLMSQIQDQLASAYDLETLLKVLVGVVKELTGFHRIMIYRFDTAWNGTVVAELVDPNATKDLYKGLHFPASDIPAQARHLYKVNKFRLLYDRELPTARLVCRSLEDLQIPLDMTHAYLRAMSPIHLQYLKNMAVRASMSVSLTAFNELWGLILCHSYGRKGMRVSFPLRKMCGLIGEAASRNIEGLSYASKPKARIPINTLPIIGQNPPGYIIASSEHLLKLFDADFGVLSIREETKILGESKVPQEALALLEYLRLKTFTHIITSQEIGVDFSDLKYAPGFSVIAGLLLVPLSLSGTDFIVFFRKGQLQNVHWAGSPYEKVIKAGTVGVLQPRESFKIWSEDVAGKSREWTEEQVETASVLCFVCSKFIEAWRQNEAAIQCSQLKKILIANASHEVRTPINAIINYLEIALEGPLDKDTREYLSRSHTASKSLLYVINDLLDLTRTETGQSLLNNEEFELYGLLKDILCTFKVEAERKGLSFEIVWVGELPSVVIGDKNAVTKCICNIAANAVEHTHRGGIRIELWVDRPTDEICNLDVAIEDTGDGMTANQQDALFQELEQVQTDVHTLVPLTNNEASALVKTPGQPRQKMLGLGLATVGRIIRNMGGQLQLNSEIGKGSRFTLQLPLTLSHGSQARVLSPHLRVAEATCLGDPGVTLISATKSPLRKPLKIQIPDNKFNVLAAEDDPINSQIMKKRIERMGYEIVLTANGDQCIAVFLTQGHNFDVILMDLQMPIMDGSTSTMRIRSIEKERTTAIPPKHAMNGRITIFAVSATLIEDKIQEYMETGFDGWIMKPIDFKRLNVLMRGIGDLKARREVVYKPGLWEKGGWFMMEGEDKLRC